MEKMKRLARAWGKIFLIYLSDKGQVSGMYFKNPTM